MKIIAKVFRACVLFRRMYPKPTAKASHPPRPWLESELDTNTEHTANTITMPAHCLHRRLPTLSIHNPAMYEHRIATETIMALYDLYPSRASLGSAPGSPLLTSKPILSMSKAASNDHIHSPRTFGSESFLAIKTPAMT